MGSLINDVTQIWALDDPLCHASMPEACTYGKKRIQPTHSLRNIIYVLDEHCMPVGVFYESLFLGFLKEVLLYFTLF